MTRHFIIGPIIRVDAAGDGHFGARRTRTLEDGTEEVYEHCGIDYLCIPDQYVFAPVDGLVTKLGFAYKNDPHWRYVQITDYQRNMHRLFYCTPIVDVNDKVKAGRIIGTSQNIPSRYPGTRMRPHIHYEIKTPAGDFLDPSQ